MIIRKKKDMFEQKNCLLFCLYMLQCSDTGNCGRGGRQFKSLAWALTVNSGFGPGFGGGRGAWAEPR